MGILDDIYFNKDLKSKRKFANNRLNKAFKTSAKENKVKEWYIKAYPSDELGEEIPESLTFEAVYEHPESIYDLLAPADDSIIRERVFEKVAELKNVDYDDIYYAWLKKGRKEKGSSKTTDSFDIQFNVNKENYRTYDKNIDGALEYIEGFYEPDSLEIKEEDIYNPEDDKEAIHVTITFNFKKGTSYDDYELGMDDFYMSLEELGAYDIHYDVSSKETEISSNKLLNKLYTVKRAK